MAALRPKKLFAIPNHNTTMATILSKLFSKNESTARSSQAGFTKSRKQMLNALIESRKNGTAIGIYSDVLGEGMFVTGVDDVYNDNNEQIVVLNQYELSGLILLRSTLSVGEIKGVCAFDMPYRSPLLQ